MAGEAIIPEIGLVTSTTSSSLTTNTGLLGWRRDHEDKKRGKWTRNIEKVGDLPLDEAERIATQLTNKHEDLTLYRWCDIREDWKKYEWMGPNDVVLRGTICLLCYQNIPQPAFFHHMRSEHPAEDADIIEILKRLSEVRLSRFQTLGVVDKNILNCELSEIPWEVLEPFLSDCGFVIRELRNIEPIETIIKQRRMKLKRPLHLTIDEEIYAEDDIKGVSSQDANDIAQILCSNGGCWTGVFYSSSFTASTASGIRKKYHRVYCPICQIIVCDGAFLRQHMKSIFHTTLSPVEEGVYDIIRRLTDVRIWKFFAANPIPKWKLDAVCGDNTVLIDKLSDFLVHRGFVINPFATESNADWPLQINRRIAEIANEVSSHTVEDKLSADDFCDESFDSESLSSRCSSAASTSSICSSSSSAGSTTSDNADRLAIPYPVMNWIRHDSRIDNAIRELEEKICIAENIINQAEYVFILGYAMYSLVVANGCKLTVLSNLREGDVTRMMEVKDSGVCMLHFSSKSTCTSGRKSSFLVLDDQVQLALRVFTLAKQRRANILRCSSVTHAENLFFVSYNMKGLRGNDVDYPISQYLKMCGISWKFRVTHLTNAAQDLVPRDFKNDSGENSLRYFKEIQKECEKALLSDDPSRHYLVENIIVTVATKTRKDKGIPKGPNTPNRSYVSRLVGRTRAKFNPYTNRHSKLLLRLANEEVQNQDGSAEMIAPENSSLQGLQEMADFSEDHFDAVEQGSNVIQSANTLSIDYDIVENL